MNTLREAAAQVLKAYDAHDPLGIVMEDLRAALAESDDDSLTAAYMMGRYDAKKAEPQAVPEGYKLVPVYQYQKADGSWIDQTEISYQYNAQNGATNIRILYRIPQPKAEPEPAAVKAAGLAGYTESQKEAWAEPQEPFGYVSEHNCEGPYKYQFHLDAATVYRDNCKSVKAVYTAPQPRKRLTDKQLEVVIYEHTKLNPNQADDRELIGYIINAIRAIEAAVWGDSR